MPERFRQQEELYCLDFFYHCHHYCHWDHRSGEDSGEEKGTGSFLLERGKQGDNKAALDFQCLLLFLLRMKCFTCFHHFSFLKILREGLWQKRAVPGACSAVFGCLLHLISREGNHLASLVALVYFTPFFFSRSLSIHTHIPATTENHWKLDFPSQSNSFRCTVNQSTGTCLSDPLSSLYSSGILLTIPLLQLVSVHSGFWSDQ